VPLEVQCTPRDVAAAVAFLVESDTVTGQILYVDGGQHLG
jgi:enoyl-[acyl-carrier-protein] reductase (NADH)